VDCAIEILQFHNIPMHEECIGAGN
jgi:hypothetical protein